MGPLWWALPLPDWPSFSPNSHHPEEGKITAPTWGGLENCGHFLRESGEWRLLT